MRVAHRMSPLARLAWRPPERLLRVRRILVGYDGSDGGKRALERAIVEAHESRPYHRPERGEHAARPRCAA
jgi:hypothetical protein